MTEEYIEEVVNPGYVPGWVENFNPANWGLVPEFNKTVAPKELHFRPRFAMALAMMRRETGTFLNLNLPTMYHEEHGWMSFNVILGKEEDWVDPPGREESLTAYMITYHIELLAGLRMDATLGSFSRLGLYGGRSVTDLQIAKNQWELKSWANREIVNPYDIHTAAILAVAGLIPYKGLRQLYDFSFLTAGGPLVFNRNNIPEDQLVLRHWI